MNPDFSQIDFYKVALWVIIVLVAGFIGQFGKSFAKHLIERFRTKAPQAGPAENVPQYQTQEVPPKREDSFTQPPAQDGLSKDEAKARKKELKAELKMKKKDGD